MPPLKMNALSAPYFVRPLHFKGEPEPPDKAAALDDTRHSGFFWQPKDCFEKQPDADSEDLQLLSKHQADYIAARTPEGEPLLSWGIQNRRPTLVNRLLAHFKHEPAKLKELVDQVDDSGYSALHHGAEMGDQPLVQTLLNARANPNQPTELDELPIHFATSDSANDQHEMVKSFIQAKSTLTARAYDLQTALHRASSYGLFKSAKLLIDAMKHDLETLRIKDIFLKTPKQCAQDGGHTDIVDYFSQVDPENPTTTALKH